MKKLFFIIAFVLTCSMVYAIDDFYFDERAERKQEEKSSAQRRQEAQSLLDRTDNVQSSLPSETTESIKSSAPTPDPQYTGEQTLYRISEDTTASAFRDENSYARKLVIDDPTYVVVVADRYYDPFWNSYYDWGYPYYGWGLGWRYPYYGWSIGFGWGYPYSGWSYPYYGGWGYPYYGWGGYYGWGHHHHYYPSYYRNNYVASRGYRVGGGRGNAVNYNRGTNVSSGRSAVRVGNYTNISSRGTRVAGSAYGRTSGTRSSYIDARATTSSITTGGRGSSVSGSRYTRQAMPLPDNSSTSTSSYRSGGRGVGSSSSSAGVTRSGSENSRYSRSFSRSSDVISPSSSSNYSRDNISSNSRGSSSPQRSSSSYNSSSSSSSGRSSGGSYSGGGGRSSGGSSGGGGGRGGRR